MRWPWTGQEDEDETGSDRQGASTCAGGSSAGAGFLSTGAALPSTANFFAAPWAAYYTSGGSYNLDLWRRKLAGSGAVPVDPESLDVVVEPSIGYRGWNLREKPFPALEPLHAEPRAYTWMPGTNTARCVRPHPAPHPGCSCGFWAYDTPWKVEAGIVGVVVGWGVLIRGEYGMRCEKAAIAGLFALERNKVVEHIERIYRVPVVDDLDRLRVRGEKMRDYMMGIE